MKVRCCSVEAGFRVHCGTDCKLPGDPGISKSGGTCFLEAATFVPAQRRPALTVGNLCDELRLVSRLAAHVGLFFLSQGIELCGPVAQ